MSPLDRRPVDIKRQAYLRDDRALAVVAGVGRVPQRRAGALDLDARAALPAPEVEGGGANRRRDVGVGEGASGDVAEAARADVLKGIAS